VPTNSAEYWYQRLKAAQEELDKVPFNAQYLGEEVAAWVNEAKVNLNRAVAQLTNERKRWRAES
jgi:hypothetical protein